MTFFRTEGGGKYAQLCAVSYIQMKSFVEDLGTHSCVWAACVPSSCVDFCDIELNI